MKDNTPIHFLAEPNQLSGKIRFIAFDGKEHWFATVINKLTGERQSGFDEFDTLGHTKAEIKKIFATIRSKSKVLEVIGDF